MKYWPIFWDCVYTKSERLRMHDEVCDFITNGLSTVKEKVQIIEEVLIPTPTGHNLKPDLMLVNGGRVNVVDVTVCH
jgi:hypothetical protein